MLFTHVKMVIFIQLRIWHQIRRLFPDKNPPLIVSWVTKRLALGYYGTSYKLHLMV